MILEYMLNLYKQFCNSTGKEFIETNMFSDDDFVLWIAKMQGRKILYEDYLNDLNVNLYQTDSVELGKGKYDSLGADLVTVISPYAQTMDLPSGKVIFSKSDAVLDLGESLSYASDYGLYLTHNPYNLKSLEDILLLERQGFETCIGMFGSKYDEDRKQKINLLQNLRDFLSNECEVYTDTFKNDYIAVLKRKNKIKTKLKTK